MKNFYFLSVLSSIFFIINLSCSVPEDVVVCLPESYVGPVLIIFNQENGTPAKYEGNKRLYEIPQNGVLRTNFKFQSGYHFQSFHTCDGSIKRSELTFIPGFPTDSLEPTIDIPIDSKFVFGLQVLGEVNRYDPDTSELLYTKQPGVSFYVGTKHDVDNAWKKQNDFIFDNHK